MKLIAWRATSAHTNAKRQRGECLWNPRWRFGLVCAFPRDSLAGVITASVPEAPMNPVRLLRGEDGR